jgi:hypothetical protein
MLTGRLPFDGPTDASIMHGQIYDDPTPIRELRSDVPAGLEELVLRLLAKKPEERPATADEVYALLMPHLSTLGELPGTVQPGLSASRMYASVVGRVFAAPTTVVQPTPSPKPPSASEPEPLSLGDVARARRQAERLTRESRFDEAARMLTRIAEKAGPLLGVEHSDVVGLRIDLANVLFTGGDYAKAAVAFQHLSVDLGRRDGPDTDLVLRFRFQEATCHAALGDGELALRQLEQLFSDEVRVYGHEDSRVTELRKQIGLLQHGIGHTAEAVWGLEQLAADLERRHGPKNADVSEIREVIAQMNSA